MMKLPKRQSSQSLRALPVTRLQPEALAFLAEEVWRLQRRTERLAKALGDETVKGVRDSATRLVDALARNHIAFEDHAGERYQEGMRLDVVHVDGEPESDQALWISDTVKPSVLLDGRLLAPGQVILSTKPPGGSAQE
jgi:hypothetical protein